MHIELLPGLDNVIRFPLERRVRPTLALLREIAPDVREVLQVAEAFGLEPPPHRLRQEVDRQTAEYILNEMPAEPDASRRAALEGLLAPVVTAAVAACRASHDASVAAVALQERWAAAKASGSLWAAPLEARAEALTVRAAEVLVVAHTRCEEAEGAARAVNLALRGDLWLPENHCELDAWLVAAGQRQ